MDRVFLHVDEFGQRGFADLPQLICTSSPLVIWAPSAVMMQSCDRALVDLTPKDLLTLVDQKDAPLRIVARREWFDLAWRRKHPWPGARPVVGFDDILAGFAIQDEHLPSKQRRVIIAGPENGYRNADDILSGSRRSSIISLIGRAFNSSTLPDGFLEKAARARSERRPISREVLRDYFNQRDAQREAHAVASAIPTMRLLQLRDMVEGRVDGAVALGGPSAGNRSISDADVKRALALVSRVKPVINRKDLFRFLGSGLRDDLHSLLYSAESSESLEERLVCQISSATELPPLVRRIVSKRDPAGLAVTLGGLLLTAIAISLKHEPVWALVPIAVEMAKSHPKYPLPIARHDKTRALFRLALGTERPCRAEVDYLLRLLRGGPHAEPR